ncbi:hypothetical protein D3C81_1364590 [compost metagenome]
MPRKMLHHRNNPLLTKPLHRCYSHLANNLSIVTIRTIANDWVVRIAVNIKNGSKIHVQAKSIKLLTNNNTNV